jgi:hypothetical protein
MEAVGRAVVGAEGPGGPARVRAVTARVVGGQGEGEGVALEAAMAVGGVAEVMGRAEAVAAVTMRGLLALASASSAS